MNFEQLTKAVETGRLRHFGQSFQQLLFSMENVAQFVGQKIVHSGGSDRWRTLRLDRRGGIRLDVLQGGRTHELPIAAFIPGSSGVDFAFVARTGRVIEEL